MAAYAATVTSLMRHAVKIDAVTGIGLYAGKVDITNYNTTTAALTAISGKFRSLISVQGGVTDNGYVLKWDHVVGSFEAYAGNYDATVDGALAEVATDVDVGQGDFIAIGLV